MNIQDKFKFKGDNIEYITLHLKTSINNNRLEVVYIWTVGGVGYDDMVVKTVYEVLGRKIGIFQQEHLLW